MWSFCDSCQVMHIPPCNKTPPKQKKTNYLEINPVGEFLVIKLIIELFFPWRMAEKKAIICILLAFWLRSKCSTFLWYCLTLLCPAYCSVLYARVQQSARGSVSSVVHGFVALFGVSYVKGWRGDPSCSFYKV